MAKGKRRAGELAAKKTRKLNAAKGGQSNYAQKRARATIAPTSPFFFDTTNPEHISVEEARRKEFDDRQQRRNIREENDF